MLYNINIRAKNYIKSLVIIMRKILILIAFAVCLTSLSGCIGVGYGPYYDPFPFGGVFIFGGGGHHHHGGWHHH
jgi:hypothetical protein